MKTASQWSDFITKTWVKDSRRLTHELSVTTRLFQRKPLLTEASLVECTLQLESLREQLHILEENLNIIQTREF